jgi:anaerobic ribonucleoside-triphosphate reductase activating protein
MNYHKIEKTSIANGSGIRVVLWCAGCEIHCYNCHNPQTWDFNSGEPFDEEAKQELFEALDKPYIQGITFSGGHPLEDANVKTVLLLIYDIRERFPDKDIWLYTGYTFESIFPVEKSETLTKEDLQRQLVVEACDVVVDGPYIESQRDITLAFRGSRNQRLIDVKKTLKQQKIITLQNY